MSEITTTDEQPKEKTAVKTLSPVLMAKAHRQALILRDGMEENIKDATEAMEGFGLVNLAEHEMDKICTEVTNALENMAGLNRAYGDDIVRCTAIALLEEQAKKPTMLACVVLQMRDHANPATPTSRNFAFTVLDNEDQLDQLADSIFGNLLQTKSLNTTVYELDNSHSGGAIYHLSDLLALLPANSKGISYRLTVTHSASFCSFS